MSPFAHDRRLILEMCEFYKGARAKGVIIGNRRKTKRLSPFSFLQSVLVPVILHPLFLLVSSTPL